MIDKNLVKELALEWLQGKDYFLVDVSVTPDDRIVVEIDHAEGVWIEDCVQLSRYIEEHLTEAGLDFELEVGSAGLGRPFKVIEQYYCHVGSPVETMKADGKILRGTLVEADENGFVLEMQVKKRLPEEKRPRIVTERVNLLYSEVKYTKYLISFK